MYSISNIVCLYWFFQEYTHFLEHLLPDLSVITICHRAPHAAVRYMMVTVFAVASVTAWRCIAELKIHFYWHYKIFHRCYNDTDLSSPDQGIAPEVAVNYRFQGGDVLANEEKA